MRTCKLYVTILAGGVGKRMQSTLPKVLHKVRGVPMIVNIIQQCQLLKADRIMIVVGSSRVAIQTEINAFLPNNHHEIVYVDQPQALGTGHAVKCTLDYIPSPSSDVIHNIILNGDVPLLSHTTISAIYSQFLKQSSRLIVTAISLDDPTGNGRIIQNAQQEFVEIVEQKDCTADQLQIQLVNCGIYIVDTEVLKKFLPMIGCSNAQGEYYLTDLVKIYRSAAETNRVDLHVLSADKKLEIANINTRQQLQDLEAALA